MSRDWRAGYIESYETVWKQVPERQEHATFVAPVKAPIVLTLVALAVAATPSPVHGQDTASSPYPSRILDRPSTLPHGMVRLDGFAIATHAPPDSATSTAILGGGIGLTDQLEIGGQFIPVSLDTPVRYTSPSVYASYGTTIGGMTLVPTLQAVFPVRSGDPFIVDVGAALDASLGHWGCVSVAPTLSLNARQEGNGSSLSLPVTLLGQAGDRVTLQLASGVGLSRFDPRFQLSRRPDPLDFDDITIPLSATVSYTLVHGSPQRAFADFLLQWQWPQLYTRAPERRGSHLDDWSVQFQTSWYLVP